MENALGSIMVLGKSLISWMEKYAIIIETAAMPRNEHFFGENDERQV